MAKYHKKTNYREKYPDLSKEIIEVLEKSDRQMEYLQYDIKVERCRIDSVSGVVTYLPSREDSYERLLEENRQFAADGENVDDAAIKAVMIEKMLRCLDFLSLEDRELIVALFYKDKSEEEYAKQIGISQKGVSKRKYRILSKLSKMMKV